MKLIEQIEEVKKTVTAYYDKNIAYYGDFNKDERDHIINIGTSILCTKWEIGYAGGGFVRSFIDNDLIGTLSRADSTCIKALKFFSVLHYNVGMPQFA